jgi:hypothetical protein
MSLYPQRNEMNYAYYCRLVRNDSTYWVEWVSVSEGDDESITAVKAAGTPAEAVRLAEEVVADLRRQIAAAEYYRDDEDGGIERYIFDGYSGLTYLKVLHPGNADSAYITGAYLDLFDTALEEILQAICVDSVDALELQLKALPDITGSRWMLIE